MRTHTAPGIPAHHPPARADDDWYEGGGPSRRGGSPFDTPRIRCLLAIVGDDGRLRPWDEARRQLAGDRDALAYLAQVREDEQAHLALVARGEVMPDHEPAPYTGGRRPRDPPPFAGEVVGGWTILAPLDSGRWRCRCNGCGKIVVRNIRSLRFQARQQAQGLARGNVICMSCAVRCRHAAAKEEA